MNAISTALTGLQNAESRFDGAAARIVRQGTGQQSQDSASLSDNAVALLQSKNDYEANLKTAHTVDEMTKATLDLLA